MANLSGLFLTGQRLYAAAGKSGSGLMRIAKNGSKVEQVIFRSTRGKAEKTLLQAFDKNGKLISEKVKNYGTRGLKTSETSSKIKDGYLHTLERNFVNGNTASTKTYQGFDKDVPTKFDCWI